MEALFVITFLLMLYDIKNNRNASDYQALAWWFSFVCALLRLQFYGSKIFGIKIALRKI
jgi:uncharacterized membrane protein YhdT